MLSIILSRRDIKEYDQMIHLYSEEKGKMELYARGVKKIISKNTAHLEPFSVVLVDIAHGKEINYITRVQNVDYMPAIRKDLHKSMCAYYVVSLLDILLQSDEYDRRLFHGLYSWLMYVETVEHISLIYVDAFVIFLLYCLGFAISESSTLPASYYSTIILMESAQWSEIKELSHTDYIRFHSYIIGFLRYHTEKSCTDWTKTCIV